MSPHPPSRHPPRRYYDPGASPRPAAPVLVPPRAQPLLPAQPAKALLTSRDYVRLGKAEAKRRRRQTARKQQHLMEHHA